MSSWREIDRLRKDAEGFRRLATSLLHIMQQEAEPDPWPITFLDSISKSTRTEYTTRQSEKLLQIRDAMQTIKDVAGFSVELLIARCHEARLDLSEDDEEWIAALHAATPHAIKRGQAGRLLRCARQLQLIEIAEPA